MCIHTLLFFFNQKKSNNNQTKKKRSHQTTHMQFLKFDQMAAYFTQHALPVPRGIHPWVVFDIDETLLAKNPNGRTTRLEPVYRFYLHMLSLGLPIAFITAMVYTLSNLEATMQQLDMLGFTRFNGLYMMPADMYPSSSNIAHFKSVVRSRLNGGVLVNVGNRWCDLTAYPEKYSEYCDNTYHLLVEGSTVLLKLPQNPFVFV